MYRVIRGEGDAPKLLSHTEWLIWRAVVIITTLVSTLTLAFSTVLYSSNQADRAASRDALCTEVGDLRDTLILILKASIEGAPDRGETKREQIAGINRMIGLLEREALTGFCATESEPLPRPAPVPERRLP